MSKGISKKNVTFITTVNHNVGDDFVREGLKYLIKQKFPDQQFLFSNIHKHIPITSRFGFEKLRIASIGKKIDDFFPLNIFKDKILSADLVIQSGAPLYWCHATDNAHCYNNEWYQSLIKRRYSLNKKAPLLNLAVGTCQSYHSNGDDFCEKCKQYIRDFYKLSLTTTVRDSLAQRMLSKLNLDASVIPCSSIFAVDEHGVSNQKGEYVVVNFMKGGSHYVIGQKIDFEKWENTFSSFYHEIKKKTRVVFVCHDLKELNAAKKIDPYGEFFYKENDFLAYMEIYSKATIGIMNRVHGAFVLASLGKPSVIIGSDTRALMAKEIGLESMFVNDANVELLIKSYENLLTQCENYKKELQVIKNKAYLSYMDNAFEGVTMI